MYSYTTGILSRKAVFTRILAKYFAICGMITKIAFLALNYGLLLIKRHQRRKIIVIYSLCLQKSDLYGILCVRENAPGKKTRKKVVPPGKLPHGNIPSRKILPGKMPPGKLPPGQLPCEKLFY